MKVIDVHSHWGTKRGYPLQTPAEQEQQKATWNSQVNYHSEAEMAQYFRDSGVQAILDFGFSKFLPMDEARALHDYAFATEAAHRDVILGHWIHIDPRSGEAGLRELRRCIDKRIGFLGYGVSASLSPPASDPLYAPFYKLCIEAKIPVLIFVGTTGLGAGLPGGAGVILDDCHPRHLDRVAATYPELKIVAARPGWPWQAETIAVLMHKRNIWYELHGWSPKYHTADLRHEIPRRLKHRIMFGADYPLLSYERLVGDWKAQGYPDDVLEGIFHRNAQAFFEKLEDMNLDLKGKCAIVGGASQGIGYGIAHLLATEGARVAITARREKDLRAAAEKMAAETGAEILPVQADCRQAADCERVVKTVGEAFGRIDILVNNDGAPPLGDISTFDDAAWQKAMEQNFMYVARMCRGVLPHMQKTGGSILNITAISAIQPIPRFGLSVASWGAVIGYAKTLALETARFGINVNTICPGYIDTQRLEKVFSASEKPAEQMRNELEQEVPLGRIGTVSDIASLVALLVSPRGSYITGTVIPVDGGLFRAVR